jgi:hypothetical protein
VERRRKKRKAVRNRRGRETRQTNRGSHRADDDCNRRHPCNQGDNWYAKHGRQHHSGKDAADTHEQRE